jgi:hypothetical protein
MHAVCGRALQTRSFVYALVMGHSYYCSYPTTTGQVLEAKIRYSDIYSSSERGESAYGNGVTRDPILCMYVLVRGIHTFEKSKVRTG